LEAAVDIFEQFQVTVYRTTRARGGYICDTNQGVRLVREYNGREEGLKKQAYITDELEKAGVATDSFVHTIEDKIVAQDEDYKTYYMKKWFDGRECDASSLTEITEAVRLLAKLHEVLASIEQPQDMVNQSREIEDTFTRRIRELNSVRNYLRTKKKKNHFEEEVQESMDDFLQKARQAGTLLTERCGELPLKKLCHGSYNHHNIIMCRDKSVVTNFSRSASGYQVLDLYDFMRKMLEKHDWDLKTGMRLYEAYMQERALTPQEQRLLAVCFLFPEKYWKIVNHYYNSNKAWFPDKDMEKLKKVQSQETARIFFTEKFAYHVGL
jgi:spore coat protein I